MDNDTPAPLSADSLRAIFEPLEKSGFPTDSVMKAIDAYTAAALQSERQQWLERLKGLKREEYFVLDPETGELTESDFYKGANMEVAYINSAIDEAVRVVLIPPTGELGGLETPDTASAGGNQVVTPVEPQ